MLNLVIYESDFDKINYNMLQVLDYIIAKVLLLHENTL